MSFKVASFAEVVTETFISLRYQIHQNALNKGFWDPDKPHLSDFLHKMMLVVTELGEASEAHRMGNPSSEKIPEFSAIEEEIADAVIRLLDMAGGFGLDIGGAIVAKMRYNEGRPRMHGKIA